MAKIKYDGVLESAHFNPDGQMVWVRVYLRKGPIFSDRIQLSRQALIDMLKKGKRFWVGERIHSMGGMFNVTQPLKLVHQADGPVIVVGDSNNVKDELAGVPIL